MSHPRERERQILDLATAQLTEQRQRTLSLEQRSVSVVTTSGALLSLNVAVLSWRGDVVERIPLALVVAAVMLLLAAAVLGILANLPEKQSVVVPAELQRLADKPYVEMADGGLERGHLDLVVALTESVLATNSWKARSLMAGLVVETLGIIAAAAVALMAISGD